MPEKQINKHRLIKSQEVFFPAACIAAIVLSVLSQTVRMGLTPWAHALIGSGHAHEMLFGFVLALICGYTLGKLPPLRIALMLTLWMSARITYLFWPGSFFAEMLNVAFALWVIRFIAPRYLVAKKWRNKVIAPLLVALFLFPLGWFILSQLQWPINPQTYIQSLIILLIMLMSFIAGRMLAPAFAGELQTQNYILKARVQPHIEAAILIISPVASLLLFHSATQKLSAFLILVLAGLLGVRMLRWQFWRCWQRSDLMGISMGYLWLIAGNLLLAFDLFFATYHPAFIHVITIGAIGTLSSVVMLKYLMPKRHFPSAVFYPSIVLIMTAVVARFYADHSVTRNSWLTIAVVSWSLSYGLILFHWIRIKTIKPINQSA